MRRRRLVGLGPALLALSFCQCGRSDQPAAADGGSDQRAVRDEGIAGDREVDRLAGVRGPKDNPNPHLAKTEMLEQSLGLGDVGQLGHGFGTGSGVGFGRGGGRMGRGRGDGGGGTSLGAGSIAVTGSHSRGRRGAAGAEDSDLPLECSDADEVVVIERDEPQAGPPGAADDDATQGTLRAKNGSGEVAGEFPLKHTEVAAEIGGSIARTEVEQIYTNPFREVIEAVYVFPLPALGAVHDFVMEIGGRKIVGLIRPREEAEQIYAEARARGQTASLLTQERPNVFTQSVANIEPGGEVKIRITYFERLSYAHGNWEWVFPMVVGPRYIPGNAQPQPEDQAAVSGGSGTASGGGGWSGPTDQVPDADRITPPVLAPGQRSGHDIGLTVKLDAGLRIQSIRSVVHAVELQEVSPSEREIKLSPADAIPNKDFVLRWSVAGVETQFGVLAHRAEGGGFFTLMMQPPLAPSDEQVTPREITFILDISGSMSGLPISISKAVVERSLDKLRPEDAFNLFTFASGNGRLWERPRPKTEQNVAEAREFLRTLSGGGGTEMVAGVRHALQAEHDPKYIQMYVFLTDGFVGNDDAILNLLEHERGTARFFGFGIGSSVNRYLIDGIGKSGGGASDAVLPGDARDGCRAVDRLFAAIDSPVLVDLRIDWNGLPVEDVYPSQLPDLFAGGTLDVVARYTGPASGTAYVEARVGTRQVRLPVAVVLPEAESANEALAPIWARWKIADLSEELRSAEGERTGQLAKEITDLAVEFRLVSDYTAFVAVDESRVVGNGQPLRVMQPIEIPDGTSYEGVFGEQPAGQAFRVPAWGFTVQATETGKVKIGEVVAGTPAERAGIRPGATLRTVNRTLVNDIEHLRGLLLQATGSVRIELDPGGTVDLPSP